MATKMTLDDMARLHDSEPAMVATALKGLADDGVSASDLPCYAWLVNHVIGEEADDWAQALDLHRRTAGDSAHTAVLRHWAAAALLGGAAVESWTAEARLAEVSGATAAQARVAVRLCAMQHGIKAATPREIAQALLPCVEEIEAWPAFGPLASLLAGSLNNVASTLLDRAASPVGDVLVRRALPAAAQACRRLWHEAGNWMNQERADYLVALCSNKVGDWDTARGAAESGLATIAANGSEDVDRAFLLLELGRAWRGLGDPERSESARAEAMALADEFSEPGLREWFDSRAHA